MEEISLNIRFIANTEESRTKGLMFSRPLRFDECILFIFNRPGNYSFWNKNVSFPLSLLFVDENYKILEIGVLQADSNETLYPKSFNIKYVVEAAYKFPESTGVSIDDKIIIHQQKIVFDRK